MIISRHFVISIKPFHFFVLQDPRYERIFTWLQGLHKFFIVIKVAEIKQKVFI